MALLIETPGGCQLQKALNGVLNNDPEKYPLVSVVLPFFNRIDLTQRALKSVIAQTYPNLETILVNDASVEDDMPLLELSPGIKNLNYVKLEKNVGPAEARNVGVRSAKGKYVAFLDSDDTWEKNKLQSQVGKMIEKGWGFSHTSYFVHDAEREKTGIVKSGRVDYVFPGPAFHCLIATPTVVLDRNLFSNHSFRPELRFAEDTILWLELSRKMTLHGIDEPLTHVYINRFSNARNIFIQAEGFRLIGKHGLAGHPFYSAMHALYRMIRILQRRVSRVFSNAGKPRS